MSNELPFKSSFDRITTTLEEGIRSRYGDPFIGTYSITFLVWNFQILLYVFSDLSPDTKHALISKSLNAWSFIAPAFITPCILLLLPWVLLRAYEFLEKNKIRLENIRHDASLELKTTANKINYLEGRIREETDNALRANNLLSEKDQAIGKLKHQVTQTEQTISDLKIEIQDTQKVLNKIDAEKNNEQEKVRKLEQENKSLIDQLANISLREAFNSPETGNEIEAAYKFLEKHKLLSLFEEIGAKTTVSIYYGHNADEVELSKLILHNLVTLDIDENGPSRVFLTDLGRELQKYLLDKQ